MSRSHRTRVWRKPFQVRTPPPRPELARAKCLLRKDRILALRQSAWTRPRTLLIGGREPDLRSARPVPWNRCLELFPFAFAHGSGSTASRSLVETYRPHLPVMVRLARRGADRAGPLAPVLGPALCRPPATGGVGGGKVVVGGASPGHDTGAAPASSAPLSQRLCGHA